MTESPLFLALDIGTSSVRAGLYNHQAEVFTDTMVKHSRQLTSTQEGGFEIDADRAFDQVVEVIDDLYERCDEKLDHAKFGVISSFWHSLVGIDEAGNPTTKLFAWAETRPARYVHNLRSDLKEPETHNRTGCPFHSSYWPAKLLWIKESLKEDFERTSLWLSFPDFMGLRMFGTAETSISMASGTGIFDIHKRAWDKPLLDYLEIRRSTLPQFRETRYLNSNLPPNTEIVGPNLPNPNGIPQLEMELLITLAPVVCPKTRQLL